MARDCKELLNPVRYGRNEPAVDVILASARLLWPTSSIKDRGEETMISVALVELKSSEVSRARMAMQGAAFMEGNVMIRSLETSNWANEIVRLAATKEIDYLDWVVAVPKDAIPDLVQLKHLPGVGQPGLAGTCIAVTDRPDLIDAKKFDLVVTEINDVNWVAGQVFRMLSTVTASFTITCLDSNDIAEVLNIGQHVQLVTVFWDDSAQALVFPNPNVKSCVARARGVFWAGDRSIDDSDPYCYNKIRMAIKQICPDAESVIYGKSVGQRADSFREPLHAVHVLCSI